MGRKSFNKRSKRVCSPGKAKDVLVGWEYIPDNENEESLLRAFEMIFLDSPPRRRPSDEDIVS